MSFKIEATLRYNMKVKTIELYPGNPVRLEVGEEIVIKDHDQFQGGKDDGLFRGALIDSCPNVLSHVARTPREWIAYKDMRLVHVLETSKEATKI